MGNAVAVCRRDGVAAGDFRCVEVEGKRILVYDVAGVLYATSAVCAHLGGPLDAGLFEGETVTCPWHGWQFDVRTGESVYDPGRRLATYPVSVVGGEILVEV
jgi:nitrite reductase/ring-hydroxylating ferredoxin subunit